MAHETLSIKHHITRRTEKEKKSLRNKVSYTNNLLMTITGAKNKSFTYDASGNTKTEDNHTYIYDYNNRLIQVTDGSITVGSYVYDGQGRRAQKVANGQTVYYLYDQYDRLIAEINGTGQLTSGYAHLPDRPLIKVDVNGGAVKVYYYHTDHHGTPLFMTDTSGQKVWSAILLPFGESYNVNEDVDGNGIPVVNNLRFPGQFYDAETGLHYNMMRDYNPQIGRDIESDPIGLGGGVNTYAYVQNNSINWVDPFGLWDPQAAASYLMDPTHGYTGRKSKGKCARAVREAINEGDVKTPKNPVSAKDYKSYLPTIGFVPVDLKGFKPQVGDIAGFPAIPSNPAGHIQMYTGKGWQSDYIQPQKPNEGPYGKGFFAHQNWVNSSFTIFRLGDSK